MRKKTEEKIRRELVDLGFRESHRKRRWILPGADILLTIEIEESCVALVAEGVGLREEIRSLSGDDFGDRLRRRLTSFRTKVYQTFRRGKRERKSRLAAMTREDFASPSARKGDDFPSYQAVRDFDPLSFCKICRRHIRESFMKTEDVCLGCDTPKAEKRKKGRAR